MTKGKNDMGNFSFDKESLRQNFFTTEGRLNRKAFIMRFFGVSISLGVFAFIVYAALYNGTGSKDIADGIAISISVVEAVIIYTLIARRLHDLGYSKVLAVVYLVYGLTQTTVMNYLTDNFEPNSMPIYAYQILSTCVIIFLVCLMFMKGVKGENRFGKDPLGE